MRNAFLLMVILFITACEGEKTGKGFIYDQSTNQPLDSVGYREVGSETVFYTDSTGHYYITGPFGSCMSGCPDFTVEFAKPGYKTITKENPNKDIFLERSPNQK